MNKALLLVATLIGSISLQAKISITHYKQTPNSCVLDEYYVPTPKDIEEDLSRTGGLVNLCASAEELGTAACEVAAYITKYYINNGYEVSYLSTGQTPEKVAPNGSLFASKVTETKASFCQTLKVTK